MITGLKIFCRTDRGACPSARCLSPIPLLATANRRLGRVGSPQKFKMDIHTKVRGRFCSWRIATRAAADPADWQRMHQEAEQLQFGARLGAELGQKNLLVRVVLWDLEKDTHQRDRKCPP
jgi:hypothetical protein